MTASVSQLYISPDALFQSLDSTNFFEPTEHFGASCSHDPFAQELPPYEDIKFFGGYPSPDTDAPSSPGKSAGAGGQQVAEISSVPGARILSGDFTANEVQNKQTCTQPPVSPGPTPLPRSSASKEKKPDEATDKRLRNRLAASKCRRKQKSAHTDLEKKARQMSEDHKLLLAHKNALEMEMLDLKNEVLLHGGCNCDSINGYLGRAAKRFAAKATKGEEASSVT
ncbi:hypothetical protein F4778DRAFT_778133 [Xylariomycetidae sp. FL2044]|nr:hypothetical protein F4778DRAFT_778133 [Xylariomycetidae sp. FL2044]